jgi:glutamate-1-semialdehyde 2,1-aminomutase
MEASPSRGASSNMDRLASGPVTTNEGLFDRARSVIPGGVDSPVRAFGSVGGTPVFAVRGEGAWIEDAAGARYVDLVQSWGALLFGHARPEIVDAATAAAARGTSFGMPTEAEVELATRIVDAIGSVDEVRLVSSGTEAAMSAVRVARGATGRDLLVKFDGCYHGHADALLAKGGGSGLATLGLPGSPGVTDGAARDTLTAPYNDGDAVDALFDARGDEIAAVIVEPIAANMGVVPPAPEFLERLRERCTAHGALLILDEVITGFRRAYAGAQSVLDVTPDLTVLGKVMGGGFPCAAFGGRRDLMEQLAPVGPVYQAGTLSGNPVAVAAGIAALDLARTTDPYPGLERSADTLIDGLREAFDRHGVAVTINRSGSLCSVFFTDGPVTNFEQAKAADHERYARFFHHLLDRGVALPPSGYELWTLGTAHGDAELERVLDAAGSFPG